MTSNVINPSRIQVARKRRGLTKVALARLADVATRTLYDWESGLATPTESMLAVLAERLRFPVEFFYRSDLEIPTPDAASFRSLRSLTAGKRDAALAAGALAVELSEWIDRQFELPNCDVPDLAGHEPEAAATVIRAEWEIRERPIGNMVHLLESRGVRVFSLAEDPRVDAFSLWRDSVPFVFLNTRKTAERSRMDAAHELGHLVLHRHGAAWGRDVEKDAQAFAAALLMPKASMLSGPRLTAATVAHLVQIKKVWMVSALALAHRMHALELLSDWNYRGLCIELGKFRKTREPEGIPRERSQVLAKVFGELGASKADAARHLALYQADVEALIFGLRVEPPFENTRRSNTPTPLRGQFRVV